MSVLAKSEAFSSFAVRDLDAARTFYRDTLGLNLSEVDMGPGLVRLELSGGREVLIYPQPTSTPGSYTILNFSVEDIDQAVDDLVARGVTFERYEEMPADERGIFRNEGPPIAWFKDPSGNVLSVMQAD